MKEMQSVLFACFRKRSAVKHWRVEGDLKIKFNYFKSQKQENMNIYEYEKKNLPSIK